MAELSLKRRRSGAISGAEKITGVKNAQAEVLLLRKVYQFNQMYKKREQDIQLEEYRLENDAKLLNLDSKRSDLEYKKRVYPHADLSHEEMTITNLEKYLVQNVSKLCYTDKTLGNKVRGQTTADSVPPVVAKARDALTRKQVLKAVEKNRKHMYTFLDNPRHTDGHRTSTELQESCSDSDSDIDEFAKAVKKNKLPSVDKVPKHKEQEKKSKSAAFMLPTLQENPKQQKIYKEKSEVGLKEKMRNNSVLREALQKHNDLKNQEESSKPQLSATAIISRMAKRKPPTKTEMREEEELVKRQVKLFCKKIEEVLWQFKEEEFQQRLKFVKDKDTEWNKFMETMQSRTRADVKDEDHDSQFHAFDSRRPITSQSLNKPVLTDREKEHLLMNNLLVGRPRLVESAPIRKRGIPHFTADRSHNQTPTAKLKRLLEQYKNSDSLNIGSEKEAPSALVAATKLSKANIL